MAGHHVNGTKIQPIIEQILLCNDDGVLTPGTAALLREYVQV